MLPQDVFSMGCVIAELFLEGKALFDLSKVTPMQFVPVKPLSWPALQGACSADILRANSWHAAVVIQKRRV